MILKFNLIQTVSKCLNINYCKKSIKFGQIAQKSMNKTIYKENLRKQARSISSFYTGKKIAFWPIL